MAQSNATNQDEYKKRMRAAGFRRAEAWIHPDDAAELRRIAAQMRDHRLTGNPFRIVITRAQGKGAEIPVEPAAEKCPSHADD